MTTETRTPSTTESHLVRIYVSRERDHWSAVIPDFTIAGRGDTEDAAAHNAADLLITYLMACRADGMSFEEARRPAPLATRARIIAGVALGHALGRRRAGVRERDVPIGPLPAPC